MGFDTIVQSLHFFNAVCMLMKMYGTLGKHLWYPKGYKYHSLGTAAVDYCLDLTFKQASTSCMASLPAFMQIFLS
jgi:hypothetical protein